ncbi:MAG: zinc/manganese transporter permease [Gammaproteobacteria bacterium SG8_15]|nr:MAG: zinc/manganese transporter permease [Gammaproteobacteria bacterium SG8_15]
MTTDALNMSIILPALFAGLLVLTTHVPLGREVLKRGIIFLDIAIAQLAALGVIIAHRLQLEQQQWLLQLVAIACALAGAVLLNFTERRYPELQEAIIGTVFVLAATGGFILLSNNPHGHEHLTDLLSGQILWVNYAQLAPLGLVSALILVIWFRYPRFRHNMAFYILFAIAITSSVQLVGIYLVFSSLIIPALAVNRLQNALPWAYVIGTISYLLGLIVSTLFDLPAGPAIVWSLALLGLVANKLVFNFQRPKIVNT